MIVDGQVHIWAESSPERPWAPGGLSYPEGVDNLSSAERPALGSAELLAMMDEVGVDRTYLVPPTFEGDRNDLVLHAARTHPSRFAAMGRLSPHDDAGPDRLASWLDQPGMAGVRLTFHWGEQRQWLRDGTADWIWPVAADCDIPLMVYVPGQLAAMRKVAAAYPRLRLVIDHFALPLDVRDEGITPVVEELVTLASLPNVAVKASALPSYVTDGFPFPRLHRPIQRVVEAFGPQRVFWGSEISRLRCSYAEVLALFTDVLDFLSDDERRLILGDGILEWVGWPTNASLT